MKNNQNVISLEVSKDLKVLIKIKTSVTLLLDLIKTIKYNGIRKPLTLNSLTALIQSKNEISGFNLKYINQLRHNTSSIRLRY